MTEPKDTKPGFSSFTMGYGFGQAPNSYSVQMSFAPTPTAPIPEIARTQGAETADAWYESGLALRAKREWTAAEQCFAKAIELQPDLGDAHYKLGTVYQAQGRADEAIAAFERALQSQPDSGDAHYNLGILLQAKGEFEAAVRHYEAAIACNDQDADAHNNLGLIYADREDHEAASARFRRALALKPDDLNACNNLGAALLRLNQLEESADWCQRALALDPDCVAAHINLGAVLLKQGNAEHAIREYRQALAVSPDSVDVIEAYTGLGFALIQQRKLDEAEATFQKALSLQPDCAVAYGALGDLCSKRRDYEGAARNYQQALAIKGNLPAAEASLLFSRRQLCEWSGDALAAQSVIALAQDGAVDPCMMLSITDSAETQFHCAQAHVRVRGLDVACRAWTGARTGHGKIRVAYVSADLGNHPVAQLLVEVLELHDRSRFEVIAVALRPDDGSKISRRIQHAVDRYFDVSAMSDQEVVALMRGLAVDIAIDLNGFTDGGRLGIFAARPAPVQVNFLGYAGTLGLPCYDYIIADRVVIPVEHQQYFTEKVAYLPVSYLPTDRTAGVAGHVASRAAQGLPEVGIVFCSFNNSNKLNPGMFDIWMRLLHQVDGSVLWLPRQKASACENLRAAAAARGVDPARVVFARFTDTHAEHLARLKMADLFLDTLPYNAHTTAVDSVRAGVPLLTCPGNAPAARVAASVLTSVGMEALIVSSLDEYEARALQLATQPALLSELRARLQRNIQTAPLFDTVRYVHALEQAYSTMYQCHLRGEAPSTFEVGARE